MMQTPLNCPHCDSKNVAFELIFFRQMPGSSFNETIITPDTKLHTHCLHNTVWACNCCRQLVCLDIDALIKTDWETLAVLHLGFHRVRRQYPTDQGLKTLTHLPKNIASFYKQGQSALVAGSYDSCGLMMRKSLEAAVSALGVTNGSLAAKIKALRDEGRITADLAEWAHEIRAIGNDAAHDNEPLNNRDAQAAASFTELFLMYVFMLPGMLAERKAGNPI